MNEETLYYKLKIEVEQSLKRKITEEEISIIKWMAENGCNQKCGK